MHLTNSICVNLGSFLSSVVPRRMGARGGSPILCARASVMLPGPAQQDFRVGFAEGGVALPGTAAREELLGGELVVKIEDATVCI